jgi:hypothetical protein
LARYRYRTPVLTGPWRQSRAAALADAVAANQAKADPAAPGGVRWLVPGEIEEEADGPALRAQARSN